MANIPSDQLAQNALKKLKPKQALAYLSSRYAVSADIDYLLACIDILHLFVDDIDFFHSVLWTIRRLAHAKSASIPEKTYEKLLYKKLAPKYVRFIDSLSKTLKLPPTKTPNSKPKRVLILGQQFLRPPYSVTMCILEFAYLARMAGIEEVKMFITNEYPTAPASTFHESMWAVPSLVIGEAQYPFKGQNLDIYSYEEQGISQQSLQANIDYIDQYSPDAVILVGDNIILGDICASFVPTLCWPTCQTLPLSVAPLQYFRSETKPEELIDWARLKRPSPALIPQKFDLLTVTENNNTISREMFNFADDVFVFAIVGARIAQEITPEFVEVIINILKASTRAHFFIIGTKNFEFAPKLVEFRNRFKFIEFIGDLRSALASCDAFLNLPRQGGGNAAYWAMLEGLPILTLDNCDVQMTIRNEAAVTNLPALQALAIDVMNNPDIRNAYIEKSARRIKFLKTEDESACKLLQDIEMCIDLFQR